MKKSRCIAIVGMACRFPGAPDLETFWRNLESGFDTITDVPEGRWEHVFYDPHSDSLDRVYCKRGGFLGQQVSFDAPTFGVMPVAARGAEPDQLLALQVAAEALADAGYQDRSLPRERTSVILGRGGYMTAGVARLEQHVRTAEQLAQGLKVLLPDLSEEELHRIKAEFQGELSHLGPDTVIGLVPNLAASRIANRLDLHGSAYTVDAACASSLVVVDQACRELLDGRADLVLAGGVHLCHHISFWSVFCQLGAVSHSQQIRPFDRRADGLLIGEGLGILALKRRADADRDGDRIYAILRGTGVASDGRDVSLMTPRVEGQILALERAWKAAGLDPQTLGLLEAHGTGTPAGDAAELLTLQRFFGGPASGTPRAGLGSVKSMIGHAMPAAGAAGLIKAALAVYHGVLPPTLHCEEPHEGVGQTRFRLITRAEPWEENGLPRRAAVNAFGFGGIDAHVVLEAAPARRRSQRRAARASGNASSLSAIVPPRRAAADTEASRLEMAGEDAEELLVLAADTPQSLIRALDEGRGERGRGPCRLALLNPTEERRARARAVVARGRPWRGREHIWFSPRGLLTEGGKTVFLFPGLEAAFEPRVEDVAGHFGLPLPPYLAPSRDILEHGTGVVGVGRLLRQALEELGVLPDAVAGHSVGEWSGMIASGVIPEDAVDPFIESLMLETSQVPDVVFAAVGCGAADAEAATRGLPEIGISHDNCPHQAILCGRAASVETVLARLAEKGVLCQKLSFKQNLRSHSHPLQCR